MFDGFERLRIDTGEVTIHAVRGGQGPPVLLLHGWPQSHVMWHKVAPALATDYTVIATDLRGYGESSKPAGGPALYSRRVMANDQVAVMMQLGFPAFAVVGHDRGARVAHRMALDHAARVTRLAVLDIVPTLTVFESVNADIARDYWHWFFLSLPSPVPERLIETNADFLLSVLTGRERPGTFTSEATAEYRRGFRDPETIRAGCDDYRAAATIDLADDRQDRDARIACPVLALWGLTGNVHRHFDGLAVWRACATHVTGQALAGGHFLPEDNPEDTLRELRRFLAS